MAQTDGIDPLTSLATKRICFGTYILSFPLHPRLSVSLNRHIDHASFIRFPFAYMAAVHELSHYYSPAPCMFFIIFIFAHNSTSFATSFSRGLLLYIVLPLE